MDWPCVLCATWHMHFVLTCCVCVVCVVCGVCVVCVECVECGVCVCVCVNTNVHVHVNVHVLLMLDKYRSIVLSYSSCFKNKLYLHLCV